MQFRYCNLIIRLVVRTRNFTQYSPAELHLGLCGFLVSGSSWTEVQCLTCLVRFGQKQHCKKSAECLLYR